MQNLCKELGFDVSLQLYYSTSPVSAGHAIAVGSFNGRTWISSNGTYEEVESEEQARVRVARVLYCKSDSMFTVLLADADVARILGGGSMFADGTIPVAVSAVE